MAKPLAKIVSLLKPKRRWAQFSLGTMLLGVAVPCVWLAVQVNRAARQRDSVAQLERVGALVFHVDPAASDRANSRVSQRWLGAAYAEPVAFVSLRRAKPLYIEPKSIAAAIALLDDLAGLQRLNLEGLPLSESDIDRVASLSDLRQLDVGFTEICDSGVARLQEALPKCLVTRQEDTKTLTELLDGLVEQQAWIVIDEFAKRFADQFQSDPMLMYIQAQARLAQGDEPRAMEAAATALAMNDNDQKAHYLLYYPLQQRHCVRWSEQELRRTIEIGPADSLYAIGGRSILAEMLHDGGDDEGAARTMEAAVQLMEVNLRVKAGNRVIDIGRLKARLHYFQACHTASSGEKAQRIQQLLDAAEYDATDSEVLIALYRLPDPEPELRGKTMELILAAATEFRRRIRQDPDEETYYNQLAWLIANTEGDYQEALRASRKSLELRPNDPSLLDTLGRCYFAVGDLENAVKHQLKAVELNPHSGLMNKQLALFQEALAKKQSIGK